MGAATGIVLHWIIRLTMARIWLESDRETFGETIAMQHKIDTLSGEKAIGLTETNGHWTVKR